jgi:hypothetical protein
MMLSHKVIINQRSELILLDVNKPVIKATNCLQMKTASHENDALTKQTTTRNVEEFTHANDASKKWPSRSWLFADLSRATEH